MKFFFSFSPRSLTVSIYKYKYSLNHSLIIVPGTVVRVASFDCHFA